MGVGVVIGGNAALDRFCSFTSALVLATTGTLEPCIIDVSCEESQAVRVNRAIVIIVYEMDLLNEQAQRRTKAKVKAFEAFIQSLTAF